MRLKKGTVVYHKASDSYGRVVGITPSGYVRVWFVIGPRSTTGREYCMYSGDLEPFQEDIKKCRVCRGLKRRWLYHENQYTPCEKCTTNGE